MNAANRASRVARTCGVMPLALALFGVGPARGNINLEFRPADPVVRVGATVNLGLYAVSDSSENQLLAAADVIFGWDASSLRLLGLDTTGAVPLLVSAFPGPPGPYNLNETVPPQDGDGFYLAYANLGSPVAATPGGALLTTFRFEALAATPSTIVAILESGGSPEGHTVVYHGSIPNTDVTGTLSPSIVSIAPCGDFDSEPDGDVDLRDFAAFQVCFTGSGGTATALCQCLFDTDGDRDIDLVDYDALELTLSGPLTTGS